MPGTHPKPYESALWQHLDTIRLLRRQRKTWGHDCCASRTSARTKNQFQAVQKFFKRASAGRIPLGFNDTGLTANTDGSPPRTEPGVEAYNDPFSVETTPEELFAKTKRRYAGEHKA
jgi:hypothetical protein